MIRYSIGIYIDSRNGYDATGSTPALNTPTVFAGLCSVLCRTMGRISDGRRVDIHIYGPEESSSRQVCLPVYGGLIEGEQSRLDASN